MVDFILGVAFTIVVVGVLIYYFVIKPYISKFF